MADLSPICSPRGRAAAVAHAVVDRRKSLDWELETRQARAPLPARDAAWVQQVAYGVVRRYWQLDALAGRVLSKPIRARDREVHFLLLVGIYQLAFMRTPQHAAVASTVNACDEFGRPWAKKLLNACLRTLLRSDSIEIEDASHHYSHPQWLAQRIAGDWPEYSDRILRSGLDAPPMCLRVNLARTSVSDYLSRLARSGIEARRDPLSKHGVVLAQARPVNELPGFADGEVSVQDSAAQLAAPLLGARDSERVLDACAAPGGKTAHILELTGGKADVTAIDSQPRRLELLRDTLARTGFEARCLAADAREVDAWWDGRRFDRILLDVPCSGTGVMRRHPDIKHRRRPADVKAAIRLQADLLQALWPTLNAGGTLLYATCSVLRAENQGQIEAFLSRQADALAEILDAGDGIHDPPGLQLLPGVHPGDGFYYCRLRKTAGRGERRQPPRNPAPVA